MIDLDEIKKELAIVAEGRAYQREHFPMGATPGRYVGHTPADEYDAATDRVIEAFPELIAEIEDLQLRLEWADNHIYEQAIELEKHGII